MLGTGDCAPLETGCIVFVAARAAPSARRREEVDACRYE